MGIFGKRKVKKVKENERKFMPPIEVEKINSPRQYPQQQLQAAQPTQQSQQYPHQYLQQYPEQQFQQLPQQPLPQRRQPRFPPIVQPGQMEHDLPRGPEQYLGANFQESAPLFVKLSKYNDILYSLEQLKVSIDLMREQIAILNEIDQLKSENMKLLETTAEKINTKLVKIDSEFTRPQGFRSEYSQEEMDEVDTLEDTISDLHSQIETLKQEVGSLA